MMAAIGAIAASSPARADCTKDTECKGDRVCEHGQCVAPSSAPAAALPPTPAPAVAPPSHLDDDRYKVDVTFQSASASDSFDVTVKDAGTCTTPCTLRGFPGHWDLHVRGAATFDQGVFVPATGARVRLTRRVPGSPTKRTIGTVVMVAAAAAFATGFVWLSVDAGMQHKPSVAAPLALTLGGAALFWFPGFAIESGAEDTGSDEAVVVPAPTATSHPVRLVGVGAHEASGKGLVPALTFEFE
jgi:hypothetical protein